MTPPATAPVQVLTTPGGAQLVAALAAAGWQPAHTGEEARRILVIHDLYSPDGRHREFAALLARLAEQACPWERIVDLSPERIDLLRLKRRREGLAAVRAELKQLLGIDRCDELVLSQNHLRLHDLLSRTFPRARRVCYGDGIGLNFSDDYFKPTATRWQKWRHLINEQLRRWRAGFHGGARWRPRRQAAYRVLLANRFDENLRRIEQLDPAIYLELFQRMGRVLEDGLGERYEQIGRKFESCSEVVALLTANFSEAERMSLEAECAGYERFIEALEPSASAGLLLKPHPRDSAEKIEALCERLAPRFRHVEVLNDEVSFYLPFELALGRIVGPNLTGRLRVACFSSACLTLHYLYGVPCLVGFGDETVRTHFPPQYIESRMRIERDLRKLLWELPPLRRRKAA